MIPWNIQEQADSTAADCIADAVRDLPPLEEYADAEEYYDTVRDTATEYAHDRCDVIYISEAWDIVRGAPDYFEDVMCDYFGDDWIAHTSPQDLGSMMCNLATLGILHAVETIIAEDCARAAAIEV